MAIAWPGTLPVGFLISRPLRRRGLGHTIRSETLSGRMKAQLVSTATQRDFECAMSMTSAQLTAFETFYRVTLVGGSQPFQGITNPRTGANTVWQFLEDPPDENYPDAKGLFQVPMLLRALPDAPT